MVPSIVLLVGVAPPVLDRGGVFAALLTGAIAAVVGGRVADVALRDPGLILFPRAAQPKPYSPGMNNQHRAIPADDER